MSSTLLLDDDEPLHLDTFYLASLSAFAFAIPFFALLHGYFPDTKRKAWLITFLSSTLSSLGSIPFLLDFLLSPLTPPSPSSSPTSPSHALTLFHPRLSAIQARTPLATALTGAFQGLLLADLLLGSSAYPDRLSPTSGWAHHSLYALLILPYVAHRHWSHLFSACLALELPTALIALSFLAPSTRNDALAASLFGVMRVGLHALFLGAAVREDGRVGAAGGSWLPAGLLVAALALHVHWFQSSVRGIVRRRRAAATANKRTATAKAKTASIERLRTAALASSLQTMRVVNQLAAKCREAARRRVTLHRSARRALVTAFPVMLANLRSDRNLASIMRAGAAVYSSPLPPPSSSPSSHLDLDAIGTGLAVAVAEPVIDIDIDAD